MNEFMNDKKSDGEFFFFSSISTLYFLSHEGMSELWSN